MMITMPCHIRLNLACGPNNLSPIIDPRKCPGCTAEGGYQASSGLTRKVPDLAPRVYLPCFFTLIKHETSAYYVNHSLQTALIKPLSTIPFLLLKSIIAVAEAAIVWAINRLLTRLRHPPRFHGSMLFRIVSEAPTKGVALALVPVMATVLFIWCWFGADSFTASSDPVANPSAINFEGTTG